MIKQEQYEHFFKTLGNRFIAGGDYNAKHPWWGSRSHIPTPEGRQLYQAMLKNNLHALSTAIEDYLKNLSATEATDYSLWKATKKIKNPQQSIPPLRLPDGKWARSSKDKANLFAEHLAKVFTPFPPKSTVDVEEEKK
ncbi:rna-directed dna polymerase from mobile element jockey-like protein [Lasius niger]|uniref:Rna-directed dna polymerase from mobile element jockey-like protein n=1 Tax=Lasius niger TaxID=67767 RepID=A0A0J7KTE6_LASNI|nr:rna-directed dna polymerase from mobile element jockey-like protein [Lasius niger]